MAKKKSIMNSDGSYIKLIKEAPVFDTPPQGEPESICPECGQKFEQYLITEKNRYTEFKKCPSCRHTKKGDDLLADAEVMRITLDYTPHAAQQKFHDSKARFRVLNCLLPDEILDGNKIENVLPNDTVLSHKGTKTKVLRSIQRGYDGQAITVNAMGILPYRVTENHPILVAKIQKNDNFYAFKAGKRPQKTIWEFCGEEWRDAKDLVELKSTQQGCNQVKYCLKIPRIRRAYHTGYWKLRPTSCKKWNDRKRFPINEQTAWLLGMYCAEGNSTDGVVYFSLNENEFEYHGKIVDCLSRIGYHVGEVNDSDHHVKRIYACSRQLAERFRAEFGDSAREKRIPDDILYHKDDNVLISFLRGYYDGDVHFDSLTSAVSAKTSSKNLSLQLQLAWARLGFFAHICEGYRKPSSINGREINNSNPFYQVRVSDYKASLLLGYNANIKNHRTFCFITDDAIYTPISDVKSEHYKGIVYDIHTEAETFILNNTVNHNCGSRFGKDRSSTMESIIYYLACLNEERDTSMIPSVYWWIIAPTERMAKQNWNELKRYFPKELVVDISNSGMMLQTVYGGLIEIRSAYDPESLVGVGLDIVTITEAARIADLDIVWANLEQRLNSPGRGLGGKGGIGIINSSPKGRNYFYKMWTWGQKEHPDYDPDWESWTFTTWDNPAMAVKAEEIKLVRGHPLTYKERLKRRLGANRYNQDILAMFLAGESKCFPDFANRCVVRVPDCDEKDGHLLTEQERSEYVQNWREPKPYESYLISYDPAKGDGGDIPAVFVIEESTGRLKRAYNMTGLGGTTGENWNPQYNKLAQISRRYNDAPVAFSKTGHETIEEELVKKGLRCITFNEQGQGKKENFVTRLEGIVEQGAFQVLDDGSDENDEVIRQYNDYARIEKRNSDGKVTSVEYCNVEEPHDDYVSCGYIAFQAISVPEDSLPFIGTIVGVRT